MKFICAAVLSLIAAAFIVPDKNLAGLSSVNSGKAKADQIFSARDARSITVSEEFLTGKTWQVMEVNDLSNCHNTHYLRGAEGNTGADYDPLKFTFRKDHSGIHTDTEGNTYSFRWQFLDAQTLQISINYARVVYTWRMVEVSENKLTATTNINLQGGKDVLVTATYTPLKTETIPSDGTDRTALLTSTTWMADEVYNNADCGNVVYHRNDTESTDTDIAFEKLSLKFNADGTGIHTDTQGSEWEFKWEFTARDQRSLRIDVANGRAVYDWNQVELKNGAMYQTCMHQAEGKDVLVSAKWIAAEYCEASIE
jgi:hypothetical protein